MALAHSPKVVTSGLVLYLDTANPKSYPGSGTTWFDLSGNGNHFTLYNGVSYTNGYLTFDGTNDYAASINNLNLTSYSSIVVEVWFASNTTSTNSMLIEHTVNWNTNTGGWGLAINTNGTADTVGMMHTNHNSEGARNYEFSMGTNWNTQINVFSIISDSTGRLTYTNGSQAAFSSNNGYPTTTTTTAGGSFANATLYVGSRGGINSYYNGKLSVVKIYGVKFTGNQFSQNFAALRGRYGI
jgi:hypothetical protein